MGTPSTFTILLIVMAISPPAVISGQFTFNLETNSSPYMEVDYQSQVSPSGLISINVTIGTTEPQTYQAVVGLTSNVNLWFYKPLCEPIPWASVPEEPTFSTGGGATFSFSNASTQYGRSNSEVIRFTMLAPSNPTTLMFNATAWSKDLNWFTSKSFDITVGNPIESEPVYTLILELVTGITIGAIVVGVLILFVKRKKENRSYASPTPIQDATCVAHF